MHKSLIALAFLAGSAITPAAAQLAGVGVGGGAVGNVGAGSISGTAAGDVGGTLSGAGAGATGRMGGPAGDIGGSASGDIGGRTSGASATGDINAPVGSVGAGAGASVNGPDAVGGTLSAAERSSQAAQMGIDLNARRSEGLIGRTVVGADGRALGTIRSVNANSSLDSVTSVGVEGSSGTPVSLDASKLSTNASGQLVADGVTRTDLSGMPSARASGDGSLIGQAVVGRDGATLGTVQDVVIGSSGSIDRVMLKAKGSGKLVAIDRSQLKASDGSLTASQLTSAQFKTIAD